MFRKIKSSLEKSENQRRKFRYNNLFFENGNNINFKPKYQKKYYSYNDINRNYGNIKNISQDEKIINRNAMNIFYNENNNFNVSNNSNKEKDNIKDENLIFEIRPINSSNKSINVFQSKQFSNYENCTNIIKTLPKNHNFDSANKYFSTDNVNLNQNKNEANNSINRNNYNRNIYFNDYNEKNAISKAKRVGKKMLIKRNNNYRTLLEREKEKEKEKSISSLNYYFNNFNIFNRINKNKKNTKMQISLDNRTFNSKDSIENINQKKYIKTNVYNNSINDFLYKSKRNIKLSSSTNNYLKKILLKSNIKEFHINLK